MSSILSNRQKATTLDVSRWKKSAYILVCCSVATGLLALAPPQSALVSILLLIAICIALVVPPRFLFSLLFLSYSFTWPILVIVPLGFLLPVRLDDLFFLLVSGRWVLDVLRKKTLPIGSGLRLLFLPMGLYLAYSVLSLTISIPLIGGNNAAKGVFFILRNLQYFAPMVFFASYVSSEKQWKNMLNLVIFAGLGVMAYSWLEWLGLLPSRMNVGYDALYPTIWTVGITGTLSLQHAHIGLYFILFSMILIGLYLDAKVKWKKLFLLGAYVSCWGVVFLSFSRSGLLGLALALAIVGLFNSRLRFQVILVLFIGLFLVTFVGSSLLNQLGNVRAASGTPLDYLAGFSEGASGRAVLWQGTWFGITESPVTFLLGRGYAVFPGWITNSLGLDPQIFGVAPEINIGGGAHNTYLTTFIELGLFGLLLLFWLLFSIVRRTWTSVFREKDGLKRNLALGYLAAFLTILVLSLGIDTFFPALAMESFLGYFWFITALVLWKRVSANKTKRSLLNA